MIPIASLAAALLQEAPAAPAAALTTAAPSAEVVALVGATLHTMVPGSTPRPGTIVWKGDRIQAVGPSVEIPEGATRVDGTGKHVIPGLIDAMVNHDADHDRLYVTSGVTLVRDVGNDLARIFVERDKHGRSGARDRGPGPAILSCGALLDGSPPSTTAAVVLDSPEAAEEKVVRLLDLEPEFLSFHAGLKEPVWRKVIEIGRAHGLQVWGPKPADVPLAQVLAAGQDGLYHLEAFLPEGKGWSEVTIDDLRPGVDLVARSAGSKKKLAITPTLSVFAQRLLEPKDNPPELAYLGPIYVQAWLTDAGLRGKLMLEDATYRPTGLRVVSMQGELVRALFERGVTIVPGSASPNAWIFPGEGLVDELGMLARAGIEKPVVLAMATSGAAAALGVDRDRGTIAAGKIADLVVLRGDPEKDLGVLHVPDTVVLRGRVLDRAEMDALRKDLSVTQKRLQGEAFKPLTVPDPPIPEGDLLLRGQVETRAMGQRIRSESYVVVRAKDGSLAYAARVLIPASASTAANDVWTVQTIRDGAVAGFEVTMKSGQHEIVVKGTHAAGILNVERRIDGNFQGNLPVRDRLAFVDSGSVTAEIAMGQLQAEGAFKVLFFEDVDPAVGNWDLRVEKDGSYVARTHNGFLRARFSPDGSIEEVQREEGRGVTTARPLSSQAAKGGLPPVARAATKAPVKKE